MLYEDIRIVRGVPALLRTLSRDHSDDIPKSWVRRAVVSYSQTETPTWRPSPALEILTHCADIEVLVRPPLASDEPYPHRYEHSTDTPKFPRLKRLDWWNHNDAARTEGINSIDAVLHNSPNVEYLSLWGEMWMTSLRQQRLTLPAVKVVHLREMNAIFLRQVCMWSLPALTHLVVESVLEDPEACEAIWEKYGPQLRVVEVGSQARATEYDHLAMILESCPGLTELNYYVLSANMPRVAGVHDGLKRVGLHAGVEDEAPDAPDVWRLAEDHIGVYSKEAFPSLTQFVLHGSRWSRFVLDPRFRAMEEAVRAVGRSLLLAADI
ncbi:hypothetical protein BV25DRAFT_1392877 [Artomyces pyxidatus]|uniref:Uncharacterized protein n=1 Tax=Artomyces pyxidatus TaxID=48021 RepID=A0ACB8TDL0_9AGAM|nr:hypothetical protein BV25DRAFT_1392877 [Artomyces pyxidatus]